ncbi:uncharacterized protein LOC109194489 isoform X2 [Oreochromis niloticus]|uniref:uncharacterized protein LOC109194489 isoform X2 n=1 Tax=Oreochromis niloticus TaxID=8128 RepID=UPI000DF124D9|nr:uncharacterized protein LOC109194489 isoform X2 [Oreochromis niloticus]
MSLGQSQTVCMCVLTDMAESQVLILKNIGDAIAGVLPDLPDQLLKSVEDTLKTLGAETTDDLKYITENGLLPVLKPIQARRLVAAWTQNVDVLLSPPSISSSPTSSTTTSSPSGICTPLLPNWVERFEIPWQRLPEELVQNLERQKRPSARQRREMVRIVVSEMMKICKNPTKHNTTEIAKRMVAKYPKSLQDVIDGDVIGPGYHSLVKQLQARVENVKRPDIPKVKKRKAISDDGNDTDEIPAEQKARVQDTYGCISWEPKHLPLSETVESQLEKKEEMKKLFKKNNYSTDVVKELVTCTYYTQRKDINKGASIQKLCQEWPFLFNEVGMTAHFQELTGVNLMETFLANVDKKGARLLKFLKYVDAQKHKQVLNAVLKLQTERGQFSGCLQEVIEMMLLLLAHFDEKEELLFHCVEMTSLAEDVQMEKVPPTPFIIVCGSSCFAAETFMLSIDKKIVNDRIATFTSAICLMFGSYYCFNIHYPVELRSTLEFLQRCFFSINPERGTKVESKKKKVFSVNPRVLTLISDIADHEWI